MKPSLRTWLYRGALRLASAAPHPSKRHFSLGVLKLDRLGDAVLSLGAVRRLLKEHAETDTLLIVSPIAEPLFRAEFPNAAMVVLPPFCQNFAPDYLRFLLVHAAQLRELQIEKLVCLRHQPSDYLHSIASLLRPVATLASVVAAPWERIGLNYPHALTVDYPDDPGAQCRELEAHRRVVELAVGKPVALAEVMPELRTVTPAEGDALLICPDAGDALRVYPAAQLAEAARQLLSRHPMPVEVCLPPTVRDRPWREAFHELKVRTWHRPADALALARTIAGAGVVLANETAPAHLATALDKRGVFLLGGGHFGLLAPWRKSDRQRWLHNRLDCYDCRWQCRYDQPRCITELAPQSVAENLLQVLTP